MLPLHSSRDADPPIAERCASKDPELERSYANYLKETSSSERAIKRDLGRTFPSHEFFADGSGVGQGNLFNVLKAYSLHDTDVGYCQVSPHGLIAHPLSADLDPQGLPFVVAVLLLNVRDASRLALISH